MRVVEVAGRRWSGAGDDVGAVALGLEERDRLGHPRAQQRGGRRRSGSAASARADPHAVAAGRAQRAEVERLDGAVAPVPAPAALADAAAQHRLAGGVRDPEARAPQRARREHVGDLGLAGRVAELVDAHLRARPRGRGRRRGEPRHRDDRTESCKEPLLGSSSNPTSDSVGVPWLVDRQPWTRLLALALGIEMQVELLFVDGPRRDLLDRPRRAARARRRARRPPARARCSTAAVVIAALTCSSGSARPIDENLVGSFFASLIATYSVGAHAEGRRVRRRRGRAGGRHRDRDPLRPAAGRG